MRSLVLTAALAAALPAFSQSSPGSWYLDVHQFQPTLTGHYNGMQNGQEVHFDLVNDLGLVKTGSTPGFGLEYQGRRFGLELAMDTQKYAGNNTISEAVTISGQTYDAQATLVTQVKLTTYTGNWTIRVLRFDYVWIGLDLGVRGTTLDLTAVGTNYLAGQSIPVAFKSGLPMPQVGLSAGYHGFGDRIVAKGYYHTLSYKGASYHHTGGDVRFFPLKWLGVRAFTDTESWKVPDNSIAKDLEIGLDRSGTGLGVVLKF